jgi:hypothetical protein
LFVVNGAKKNVRRNRRAIFGITKVLSSDVDLRDVKQHRLFARHHSRKFAGAQLCCAREEKVLLLIILILLILGFGYGGYRVGPGWGYYGGGGVSLILTIIVILLLLKMI